MNNQLIVLKSGHVIPLETVEARVQRLGWSTASASSTPINSYRKRDGAFNVADAARNDNLVPSKVQLVMRQYGVDYTAARDYLLIAA